MKTGPKLAAPALLVVMPSLLFPMSSVAQLSDDFEGLVHETPQMMCGVVSLELIRNHKQLEQARRQLRGKKGRQRSKAKERYERRRQRHAALLDEYQGLGCLGQGALPSPRLRRDMAHAIVVRD